MVDAVFETFIYVVGIVSLEERKNIAWLESTEKADVERGDVFIVEQWSEQRVATERIL